MTKEQERLTWSKVFNVGNYNAEDHAGRLRRALVDADVYPPREAEAGTIYQERIKATLPEILDSLDATDLLAVYRVARLLAIVERGSKAFEYSNARTKAVLEAAGYDLAALRATLSEAEARELVQTKSGDYNAKLYGVNP